VFGAFPIVPADNMASKKQAQRDSSNGQENTEDGLLHATNTNTDQQQKLKDDLEHKTNTNDQQPSEDEVERFKTEYAKEVVRLHGEMTDLGNKLEQLRDRVLALGDEVFLRGFSPELSAYVQRLSSSRQDVVAEPSKDLLEDDLPLKHPKV
jgi:hypothetical protein